MKQIFATLALCFCVTACMPPAKQTNFALVTEADVANVRAHMTPEIAAASQKFLFDLQVVAPDGGVVPQGDQQRLAAGTKRALLAPSAIEANAVTATTGLWETPPSFTPKGRVDISVGWSGAADPLSPDAFQSVIARFSCDAAAQKMAVAQAVKPQIDTKPDPAPEPPPIVNNTVPGWLHQPPYKVGDTWILPLLVRVKSIYFTPNCL